MSNGNQAYRVRVRHLTAVEIKELKSQQQAANKSLNDQNQSHMIDLSMEDEVPNPEVASQAHINLRDTDVPNTIVIVKNVETLDEYQLKTWIEPDYLPKIDQWI